MAKKRVDPYRNVVVISDLHSGCQLALCPDEVKLDSGGIYRANKIQKALKAMWDEFWGEVVPSWTKGEPFVVIFNGDAVDGAPHGSISQISPNRDVQNKIAYDLLNPVVMACDGRYFHTRGTGAHVGQSAESEEQLARMLCAKPDREGNHARYDLWLRCGPKPGGLIHALHHVGTTSRAAYESSAVHAELTEAFCEAARWGQEPPDAIVRSHRHRNIEIRVPTSRGNGLAVVSPAWQGKTPYAWKIAGARQSNPQFGGLIIQRVEPDGLYCRSKVWSIARSELVNDNG